jgi:hypothetical protein
MLPQLWSPSAGAALLSRYLVPGRGSAETTEHHSHPAVWTEPRLIDEYGEIDPPPCCLPLSSGTVLVTVPGRRAGVPLRTRIQ